MSNSFIILALIGVLGMMGCTNVQAQWLDGLQPSAMQTAASRGQAEMNCPTVTPTVMSRQMAHAPGYYAPWHMQLTQYTINLKGCGKEQEYSILCPFDGTDCYPATPGSFVGTDTNSDR
jgi:hypothetical protein